MKLYAITTKISGTVLRYEGTQADATRAARNLDAKWEATEIPTDKAGLIAHLNSMCPQEPQEAPQDDDDLVGRPAASIHNTAPQAAPEAPAAQQRRQPTVEQLEVWIMDEASQADVERVFTALGTRFGEMRT